MKIVFYEIEDWEKPYIEKHFINDTVIFHKEPLLEANLLEDVETAILSIFIYTTITEELLQRFPNLKLIVTRSTGFDHIDMEACKKRNIIVANVPVYGTNTVAEHTFALILALSRKLIPSVERTRKGDFSLDNLRGFDLYGKTLGIIGLGNIGKAVIHIAKGFNMKILVYTKHPSTQEEKDLQIRFVDLNTLLNESDVISLHVPYDKDTHHIINKENISQCKRGSLLINTSRGGLIETEAILTGLDEGYLQGAGIDVLEEECYVKEERQLLTEQFLQECDIKTQLLNHVLLTKENVIITPHNAFNSTEALTRILDTTVENITSFINNQQKNVVTV